MDLPDPPADNLPFVLARQMDKMNAVVHHFLTAAPQHEFLKENWTSLARCFGSFIHRSQPDIVFGGRPQANKQIAQSQEAPSGKKTARTHLGSPTLSQGRMAGNVCVLSDDDEDFKEPITPSKGVRKRVADSAPSTPHKKTRLGGQSRQAAFGPPSELTELSLSHGS